MRRRNLSEIKALKAFEINDVFLYVFLIVAVLILFVAFVFLPNKNLSDGFTVTVNGKSVCSYTYSDGNLTVEEEFKNLVTIKNVESGIIITVFIDQDKSGYNVIYIDSINSTAKVVESSCSISKDCVHSPAISKSGAIFCAPHGLKIIPIGQSGAVPPITG